MNPCAKCKRPMELKCCHNCKKDASKCDVWHICGQDCKEWEKQIPTNADRIRAMTDDELNKLFHEIYNAGAEDAFAYELGQRTNSFEWTMEWLKQAAEGE